MGETIVVIGANHAGTAAINTILAVSYTHLVHCSEPPFNAALLIDQEVQSSVHGLVLGGFFQSQVRKDPSLVGHLYGVTMTVHHLKVSSYGRSTHR